MYEVLNLTLLLAFFQFKKNWFHANANFFQVQDCLKNYSCFSCEAVFMSDVNLTCCKPIANFARGVIPCRFLLKAKAMTYVILVLT